MNMQIQGAKSALIIGSHFELWVTFYLPSTYQEARTPQDKPPLSAQTKYDISNFPNPIFQCHKMNLQVRVCHILQDKLVG